MSGPGPGEGGDGSDGLDVELEALRADGRVWLGAADALEQHRDRVRSLAAPPAIFSKWGVNGGLADGYERLRAHLERLLGEGGGAFRAIGTSLTTAADVYGREDAAQQHEFEALRPGGR